VVSEQIASATSKHKKLTQCTFNSPSYLYSAVQEDGIGSALIPIGKPAIISVDRFLREYSDSGAHKREQFVYVPLGISAKGKHSGAATSKFFSVVVSEPIASATSKHMKLAHCMHFEWTESNLNGSASILCKGYSRTDLPISPYVLVRLREVAPRRPYGPYRPN
jgi:hypothetical protein